MNHDLVLRTKVGVTQRTVIDRVLRVYDRASGAEREAGATWYDVAGDLTAYIGQESGYGRVHAAAVVAHLSPRFPWPRNVAAAEWLLMRGERFTGVLHRSYRAALASMSHPDPGATLSGPKTRRFFLNLIGDYEAVTVDVWATRAAGVTEDQLKLAGVYDAVEHAFRLAARRRDISPAAMQATTWVVTRGGDRSGAHVPLVLTS